MKFVEVRELYKDTIKDITKNEDNWLSFLKSASWNFKYNFDDQILIYAQKPNATACAEMKEWNERVRPRRWVNKDTRGIAIFAKEGSKLPLRFVFDIEDTHNYNNTKYHLWTAEEKYQAEIMESLEDKFGELTSKESFEQAIILSSYNMVTDNLQDYMPSILKYKKGTSLETMTEDEIKMITLSTIWTSVAYMMMNRCGINPELYINKSEFLYIKNFTNNHLTTVLGTATRDIAESGLREIAKTVRNLKIQEKNENRTFVEKQKEEYSNNEEKNVEGGINYEQDRIQETGRLSDTKHNNERGDNTKWKIRKNEIKSFEEQQQSRIHNITNGQQVGQTPSRDTTISNEDERADDRENEETRWFDRRNEDDRPNEMGRTNEQLQNDSRGTDNEGTNLQLEQTERKKWTNERNNIKEFYDDETINEIIKNSPNIKKQIEEIKKYLKDNIDDKEKCEKYVSNIFSDAYTEYIINDNERVGHKTYSNGLNLWKGNYLNRTEETFIHWYSVAQHLVAMMVLGELDIGNIKLLTEQEQISLIKQAEVNDTSVFSFPQEVIDRTLQNGSMIENGKFRIYKQLTKGLSSKENAEFLKHEYGDGGYTSVIAGSGIDEDHSAKGIRLSRGYNDDAPTLWITWLQAEKRIKELISLDRYFNDKEKEKYQEWLNEQEEYSLIFNEENNTIQIIEKPKELLPEENVYRIADRVYIGADEFEIINISNDKVTVSDVKFPLFMQQFDFTDFDKKVKETPYNDHLKKSNRDDLEEESKEEIVDTGIIEDEKINIEEIENAGTKIETETNIISNIKKKRRNKIEYFDLHPEIPLEERNNYKIINNELGVGTPKQKYLRNIEAIKVLKKCEEENRYATKEEQEIMAQYIGWGGLPDAFNKNNSSWSNEYEELKGLLTEKEYKEARQSTLTAFYTPPIVISSIYKALENMGLEKGNILEPSCRNRKLYGNVTR